MRDGDSVDTPPGIAIIGDISPIVGTSQVRSRPYHRS